MKNKPSPYAQTDFQEDESIHIFKSSIDRKRIKTDIKSRDKYPNFDGYIEVVDDDQCSIGKFELQVKTIKNSTGTFYCKPELINYSEITTLPILLILVKIDQKKTYWKHLIRENAILTEEEKSYKFIITDEDLIQENKNYIFDWITILNDYQQRILNYKSIESMIVFNEFTTPPINTNKEQIEFYQLFVDQLNNGIERTFPFLKKYKFTDVWKLGVAIQKYNNGTSFGIFAIPNGKTDLLIKEINTKKRINPFDNNHRFLQFFSSIEKESNYLSLSNRFLKNYLLDVIKNRAFFFKNLDLATECVFSFVQQYHFILGIKKSNKYDLRKIKHRLSFYFPIWISVALDTIEYPPHIPHIDISLFTLNRTEEINKKTRNIVKNRINYKLKDSLLFHSEDTNLFHVQQSLNLLINNNINEISSPFPAPNYTLIKKNKGFYPWELYTKSDIKKTIESFYSKIFYIINDFCIDNNFPAEFLIKIKNSYKFIVVAQINKNLNQPGGIEITLFHVETLQETNPCGDIIFLYDLDFIKKNYSYEWFESGFELGGNKYKLNSWQSSIDIGIFHRKPYYDFLYKYLESQASEFFKSERIF
ncbi:DUF4365 domain-containing protein [Leptospira bandrabouensis]|uniref:DUF4365 domain-containing protein n=1 Tax=Leptospira bandrabouensis TaxID=2484903 RepID=A0A6H3NTY1_9LEPT|nr:DUF4365 domain-containing protein [Leptospira bandrabouensis]TGN13315.1 DUF4365 domain-containing protein [Leptospira bandrabouensis]